MSVGLIALTPVAVVLGYLGWQSLRSAGHWVLDRRRRDVSDAALGSGPEAAGATGIFDDKPTAQIRVKSQSDSSWELTIEPIGDHVQLPSGDDALIEYVIPSKPTITRDGVAEVIAYSDRGIVVWLPRFDEFRVLNKAGQILIEVGTIGPRSISNPS
ncbi:hypothetical protein BST43_26010 [Mycobacteroides saopaulense]|uniref:Uncharacterized protein n=1 Tax=Mycobacteroides saopaulense TaxID=1578165 RepID=A0A1X0IIQ1_9MYCO|nr:hypothetical protein BST43_26010 [Mycobacteroides saopaulense]